MNKLRQIIATITFSMMLVATLYAGTAYWTGRSRYVTTVTGRTAISCEYNYAGKKFWKTFESSCPNTIEVY